MFPNDSRPGDRRNFVHKRIFGAIGGALGGLARGGPLGAIGGALGGFAGGGGRATNGAVFDPIARGIARGQQGFAPTTITKSLACPPGFKKVLGQCLEINLPFAGPPGAGIQFRPQQDFGEAVMGQYGAALEPGIRESDVRVCPRGTVLGTDGLCYNRRDIRNSERMWPRGRRPLLTGGDMRCISIAAAAAKKIEKKTKQLQSMGMLKKPSSRRQKALPAGHHAHVQHD